MSVIIRLIFFSFLRMTLMAVFFLFLSIIFCEKILVVNGKLLSAEKDEFILHECLVHPALLFHHKYVTLPMH